MKFFLMMILLALVTAIQPAGAQWRHNGGGRRSAITGNPTIAVIIVSLTGGRTAG